MSFIISRSILFTYLLVLSFNSLSDSTNNTTAPISTQPPYPAFTAHYQAEWKGGWFPITVNAIRSLNYDSEGNGELKFVADSAIAGLEEVSSFRWQDEKIKPLQYRYLRSGLFSEPDRDQRFNWQQKNITNGETQAVFSGHWHDEVQDNLSYNLQASIDLKNGKTQFTYPVFDRKKIKDFNFQLVKFETINTRVGTLRTIKVELIESKRKKSKKKTFIWFAQDYDYLLVRLKQEQKDGQVYEINLTAAEINGKTLNAKP